MEGGHIAHVVRAWALPAARVTVRSVVAFIDITERALPEARNAIEVASEVAWRATYETAATEVVAPRIGRRAARVWRWERGRWGGWTSRWYRAVRAVVLG